MSKECPFLVFEGGIFGSYKCRRRNDEVVSSSSSLYKEYCGNYESGYSKCPHFADKKTDCFLTTACVEHKGLPDDCHELTMMRRMRDEWLLNQPGGREEIAEYYAIAPCIVAHINARPDAAEVWEKLYQEYILPCVAAADAGEFEKAHEVYREMVIGSKEGNL